MVHPPAKPLPYPLGHRKVPCVSLLASWQKTDLSKCKSDWATCCSQNPLFLHQDPKAERPLQRPSAITLSASPLLPVLHLRLHSSFKDLFPATSQKLPSLEGVQLSNCRHRTVQ